MFHASTEYKIHFSTPFVEKYIKPYIFKLKPHEWSYIAGLVDSDGSITIGRVGKSKNYVKYRPEVYIANNSQVLMQWLKEHVPYHNVHTTNSGCHMFAIYNLGAVYTTLLNIVDRVVLKHHVAKLALKLAYMKIVHYRSKNKAIHDKYNSIFKEVKQLNRSLYGFSLDKYNNYYEQASKEELYAYLAGVVDGDGSISVMRDGGLLLSIGTRHGEYAKWLQHHISGSYITFSRNTKGNIVYNVMLRGRLTVLELLYRLEPHLVVKRDKARKIIESFSSFT